MQNKTTNQKYYITDEQINQIADVLRSCATVLNHCQGRIKPDKTSGLKVEELQALISAKAENALNSYDSLRSIAAQQDLAPLIEASQNARNTLAGLAIGDLKSIDRNSPALLALRQVLNHLA